MEKSDRGRKALAKVEGHETKLRDEESEKDAGSVAPEATPKKRRKVNHACIYCRRSHMTCDLERPCTRCIKRNIGHLCHDEPRDPDPKKAKNISGLGSGEDAGIGDQLELSGAPTQLSTDSMGLQSPFDSGLDGAVGPGVKGFGAGVLGQNNPIQLVQPAPASGLQASALNNSSMNQYAFSDAWLTTQNHFHDMHNYHPNYIIAPEVTHEFNLLNDFLHTSMLDDGAQAADDAQDSPDFQRPNQFDMLSGFLGNNTTASTGATVPAPAPALTLQGASMLPPPAAEQGRSISRPGSVLSSDKDKAKETYYLQAADPSGNDTPEERMQRVLKAKYDAGLLKQFNYVKGYARLSTYLDSHISTSSKNKILRTLERFRPKFREKAQSLTDMELVFVEMWFEKQLLEHDRVFASMAVPACLWRRTGEIFRGNKEMAELIHVPVERLRDGMIALHDILTEESLVRYWEEFETIAFDPHHDTLLTACALKDPDEQSNDPIVNCAFSFMIRRDDHKMPTLIVGNFLPHDPHN